MIPTGSNSADSSVLRYRSDIDGLRAIAVVSVILFHLSPSILAGGFLGVDLFFVLSGYLITSIILKEIHEGRFTITKFYERRIRRIIPALIFLIAMVSAVSFWILLPKDLVDYGKSVFASLAFYANIFFWRDVNYFSSSIYTKPLIHIWSLGVEEQFYIFFPILLVFLSKFWRSGLIPIVVMITLSSVIINFLAYQHGLSAAAFYFLPTRAWELGAGAIVGLCLDPDREPTDVFAGWVSFAGLVLIANGLAMFAHTLLFSPNLSIVAGTCLLIAAGRNKRNVVTRALSLPIFTGLGLISYSLYLWHWPIIVGIRYYTAQPLGVGRMVGAACGMLVISYISWRFVEAPFRRKTMRMPRVLGITGGGVALLALAGMVMVLGRGFPQRLDRNASRFNAAIATNYHCLPSEYFPIGPSRGCSLLLPSGKPEDADMVLLGNSHAQMYAPVWKDIIADRHQTGVLIPLDRCQPTPTVNIDPKCAAEAAENLEAVLGLPKVKTVVVATTWVKDRGELKDAAGHTLDNRQNAALQNGLDYLIGRLRAAGKNVVLIGPIPLPKWEVASVLARDVRFGRTPDQPLGEPAAQFEARFSRIISHFKRRDDISVALPHLELCDRQTCHYVIGGRAMYADNNHLAQGEVWRFRKRFAAAYDRARYSGAAPGSADIQDFQEGL
ncbi:acyltransferase [Sphingomonas koreensis]|nr:acyltransferase [Sphingomonas koreensis]